MTIRWRTSLFFLIVLVLVVAVVLPLAAQSSQPGASIEWPPPVFAISGAFPVRGSANLSNMNGYFLEFRPLANINIEPDNSVSWQPATLPGSAPVTDGLLGVWNTAVVPDGLYELRLSVLTTGGQFVYAVVSPLRVLNNPPQGVTAPIQIQPFPTALPTSFAPPPVQPTAVTSSAPQAPALLDGNVRRGDSVVFPTVGALLQGQRAPLMGVSANGTGWWLVELPDGQTGWIAPSVVQVSGDINSLPTIQPPPFPTPTPLPSPIPTSTAVALVPDAIIQDVHFDHDPHVNQAFNIIVTIANQSPIALPRVAVSCNFTPQNTFVNTYLEGLAPYGQTDVSLAVTLTTGGGADFTANCAVDVNNLVPELAEFNNYYNRTAALQN